MNPKPKLEFMRTTHPSDIQSLHNRSNVRIVRIDMTIDHDYHDSQTQYGTPYLAHTEEPVYHVFYVVEALKGE